MPDTSAAREQIRFAYSKHRNVMGGMSTAMLKLEAAAGLHSNDPDAPLPYPEDSPVWFEHAEDALDSALSACDALRDAIRAAAAVTRATRAQLARDIPATAESENQR